MKNIFLTLIIAFVSLASQAMDFTSYYSDASSVTGGAATVIVAPADNINGVEVTNMYIRGDNYAGAFVGKTSAPSNITGGAILLVTSGAGEVRGPIEKISVPAGMGIYFITTSNASPTRSMLIKIL